MRILIFIPKGYPKLGGSEIVGGLLARRFHELGHSVTILAPRLSGQARRESVEGVPVLRCGPAGGFDSAGFLRGVLAPFAAAVLSEAPRVDVFLSIGANRSVALGIRIARWFGRPWVVKLQTGGPEGDLATLARSRGGARRVARVARLAARFAAITEETYQELVRADVPVERIVRIPNCVDTDRYAPLSPPEIRKRKAELGAVDCRVVFAGGRMVPRKRLDLAIDAFSVASQDHPDLLLWIAGDGPLRQELEDRARASAAASRIRFLGPLADTSIHLQASGIYLHTADAEGLPLAVLEAMSAGAVVVASRIGGIVDAVEPGRTGFLFEPGSASAGAEALGRALSQDGAILEKIWIAARDRVLERFSLVRVADLYQALFSELLEAKE